MTVTRLTKWASSCSVLFFSLRLRFSLVVLAIRLALSFSFWHTHTHTHTHIHTPTHTHTHMHAHTHTATHAHTHPHTYTRTHAHTVFAHADSSIFHLSLTCLVRVSGGPGDAWTVKAVTVPQIGVEVFRNACLCFTMELVGGCLKCSFELTRDVPALMV